LWISSRFHIMKRMSRNQRPSRQVLRVSAPNTKSAVSDYILFYFSFASGLIFNFGLHDFCFWTKPAIRRASHRTTPRLNYTLFKTLTPIFIWVIKLDSPRRSLFRYCGFCSAGVASGIMRLCASSCAGRWNYVTFQLLERWRYMLFISRITARLWIAGLRTGNYQSAVIWTRSTVRFDVHHIVRSSIGVYDAFSFLTITYLATGRKRHSRGNEFMSRLKWVTRPRDNSPYLYFTRIKYPVAKNET